MRRDFIRTNTSSAPHAATFTAYLPYPNKGHIHIAERNPRACTLRGVFTHLGLSRSCFGATHYQMGDRARDLVSAEFYGEPVNLRGSYLAEISDEVASRPMCAKFNVHLAAGVFPAGLIDSADSFFPHSCLADSAQLADSLSCRWGILVRGPLSCNSSRSPPSYPLRVL